MKIDVTFLYAIENLPTHMTASLWYRTRVMNKDRKNATIYYEKFAIKTFAKIFISNLHDGFDLYDFGNHSFGKVKDFFWRVQKHCSRFLSASQNWRYFFQCWDIDKWTKHSIESNAKFLPPYTNLFFINHDNCFLTSKYIAYYIY